MGYFSVAQTYNSQTHLNNARSESESLPDPRRSRLLKFVIRVNIE